MSNRDGGDEPPGSAANDFPEGWIDPYGGPDTDEPDPDFDPAGNSRFHGSCGTCGGRLTITVLLATEPWTVEEVTCFACGGSGGAEDEALCTSCHGARCPDCGRSGYSVDCPYDPPDAYYWSDPWTPKE